MPRLLTCFLIKVNILVDHGGHARLADFGLLTIISDSTNFTVSSSMMACGTTRWMAPELHDPDKFGLKDSRATRESDCYALGMVILEVLSRQAPFAQSKDVVVLQKVIKGERPGRPEGVDGVWFTDDLWQMLNLCWESQPGDRPTIQAVLECLEQVSSSWTPLSPQADEDEGTDESEWDLTVDHVVHPVWSLVSSPFTLCLCGGFHADRVFDPLSELISLDLHRPWPTLQKSTHRIELLGLKLCQLYHHFIPSNSWKNLPCTTRTWDNILSRPRRIDRPCIFPNLAIRAIGTFLCLYICREAQNSSGILYGMMSCVLSSMISRLYSLFHPLR